MRNIFVCWSCGRRLTIDREDNMRPTKCPCTRAAWVLVSALTEREREPYADLMWLELESQLANEC